MCLRSIYTLGPEHTHVGTTSRPKRNIQRSPEGTLRGAHMSTWKPWGEEPGARSFGCWLFLKWGRGRSDGRKKGGRWPFYQVPGWSLSGFGLLGSSWGFWRVRSSACRV